MSQPQSDDPVVAVAVARIADLHADFREFRKETKDDISALRVEVRGDMSALRMDLESKLSEKLSALDKPVAELGSILKTGNWATYVALGIGSLVLSWFTGLIEKAQKFIS